MAERRRQGRKCSSRQAGLTVIRLLREAGYQSLFAGGCVRDMLMGREANDYDVATDARPEQVVELFQRTLSVGAQFGVVVVLMGGQPVEVVTFRGDQGYSDGRHPDGVEFCDARGDAERRDFTINGMFYDPLAEEVIDYVGGRGDLAEGVIRAIGDPDQRFAEDYLRILRAVRFAARLAFRIDPATWEAMAAMAPRLTDISAERIATELGYILEDRHRFEGVMLLEQVGALTVLLPEITAEQWEMGTAMLKQTPVACSVVEAMASLLWSLPWRQAEGVCRSLKLSNDTRRGIVWPLRYRSELLEALPLSKGRLKQWLAKPGCELLRRLLEREARITGRGHDTLAALAEQISQLGDEPIQPSPLLTGNDLIAMGVAPGRELGKLLERLYLAQLEGELTTAEQARQWVRDHLAEGDPP